MLAFQLSSSRAEHLTSPTRQASSVPFNDMNKQNVLFLCAHNAARSQMAEALLRRHAGDQFNILSAGLEPTTIHPLTLRVLNEIGIDASRQEAKGMAGLLGKHIFQLVIFVCERTQANCPHIFPFALQTLNWPFEDPAAATGTEEEQLAKFRAIRDQIEDQIVGWLESQ
jgi:arsenate reductase